MCLRVAGGLAEGPGAGDLTASSACLVAVPVPATRRATMSKRGGLHK